MDKYEAMYVAFGGDLDGEPEPYNEFRTLAFQRIKSSGIDNINGHRHAPLRTVSALTYLTKVSQEKVCDSESLVNDVRSSGLASGLQVNVGMHMMTLNFIANLDLVSASAAKSFASGSDYSGFVDVLMKECCTTETRARIRPQIGFDAPPVRTRTFLEIWRGSAGEGTPRSGSHVFLSHVKHCTDKGLAVWGINAPTPTPTQPTGEIEMTNAAMIETVTLVYGKDTRNMSEAEVLAAIQRAEKELETMADGTVTSKKLVKRRVEHLEQMQKLVELYDAM